jgi:hypothetical protein
MIPYKGEWAFKYLMIAAADPNVISISPKAQIIHWWNGERWEAYRPRYTVTLRHLPGGVARVIDVEVLNLHEYRVDRWKYNRIAREAISENRTFKVYHSDEIRAEPRYTNALIIDSRAKDGLCSPGDLWAIRDFAKERETFTINEIVVTGVMEFEHAYTAVLHLVAAGEFEIRLDILFDRFSPVRKRRQ